MVMIGTNQYPNLKESMLDKVVKRPAITNQGPPAKYQKLNLSRNAQTFEMLRLALEKFVASGKKKPAVYLLTFGNLTMRKAKAAFATNFFGCAGYEILENATFKTVEEEVKSLLEAKPEIVVICSSDEEYATIAPSLVEEIKKVNPAIKVIVAVDPKEIAETLKSPRVDDFIHARSNLVETLTKFHKMIGII
jgi:methylmalonyl-CoA mutase